MSHPFDRLVLDNGATFLFTPCPGTKGFNLEDSLATLKAAGATTVVTALPDTELLALDVAMLGDAVSKAGMDWFQLPIEDDCAPADDFTAAYDKARTTLVEKLKSGDTIAVHCRGGSGRTGLLAAILMRDAGYDLDSIISQVQALRPNALTIPAHLAFLKNH
ncbi:dual specificity protein phosphatase family protein [Parendozoicomonas haliclonae]|uniref:Dual specificity phosphatase, catalytic domain n=1 Tax=Parendozoicomonas haliclonae TaxID=1960125 RepID=A0A1X7ARB0_9GAMM|nr:dual specificity protein phosphatase family protein [Parendozoicomonas haliclonae]SMA50628.1 Dual specificity phosphatase, catalytic domain [Parendozoicomonas haliclonae]